jgi:hypothetical protein
VILRTGAKPPLKNANRNAGYFVAKIWDTYGMNDTYIIIGYKEINQINKREQS